MNLYDSQVWGSIYLLLPKFCVPPLDIPYHLHTKTHTKIHRSSHNILLRSRNIKAIGHSISQLHPYYNRGGFTSTLTWSNM